MTPRLFWGGGLTGDATGQRGVALIVGLIMLVIISLVIVGAFSLSATNAKSVGNMQVREEALAAANQAVEVLISSNFTVAMNTNTFTVDINKDGTTDYVVNTAVPTCIRAVKASDAKPSDVELGPSMSGGVDWLTDWDIDATVSDAATGASVRVRQGVRVKLTESQKSTVCP